MLTVYNSVFCSYVRSLKAAYFAKCAESVLHVLSGRAIEVLLSFVSRRQKSGHLSAYTNPLANFPYLRVVLLALKRMK